MRDVRGGGCEYEVFKIARTQILKNLDVDPIWIKMLMDGSTKLLQ